MALSKHCPQNEYDENQPGIILQTNQTQKPRDQTENQPTDKHPECELNQ
ncbi:MAG: hypothetical protein Q4D22_01805 [Candidatus Saccharibacteria bacterium]|nr:hypothetical protein [Candidatus Saccharibacteria bacterium]